jgi:hypothetical protein
MLPGCDRSLIRSDQTSHPEAWLLAGCWLLDVTGNRISPKFRSLVEFATQAPPAPPRPRSTPMAAQAPELPAGREPMSERWCYFCGRKGTAGNDNQRDWCPLLGDD